MAAPYKDRELYGDERAAVYKEDSKFILLVLAFADYYAALAGCQENSDTDTTYMHSVVRLMKKLDRVADTMQDHLNSRRSVTD